MHLLNGKVALVTGAARKIGRVLAHTLAQERDRAFLFRTLATLRTDIPLFDDVEQLKWNGPGPEFAALGARFDAAKTETKRTSQAPRRKSGTG